MKDGHGDDSRLANSSDTINEFIQCSETHKKNKTDLLAKDRVKTLNL